MYLLIFCYMMIIFAPKENLYYFALEKLESKKVELISNKVEDNYLSFDIETLTVNYDNITVAKINHLSVSTYLYSTKILVENVKANDVLKNFIPEFVKEIVISHTIIDPLKIGINTYFKKGRAFGHVDLMESKIVLNLDVPKSFMQQYRNLTQKFKKNGKYYTYEFKY